MLRWLLIGIGWIALALGLIGALLPLLPTTPFALLAAACFARASQRCHAWLLSMPVLGPAIADWQAGRGVAAGNKMLALGLLWSGMFLTVSTVVPPTVVAGLLVGIAGVVTLVLLRLPTRSKATRANTRTASPGTMPPAVHQGAACLPVDTAPQQANPARCRVTRRVERVHYRNRY